MIIDTADIKRHLRIEVDSEDLYLEALGRAAVEAFENMSGKILYPVGADLSAEPEGALIITDGIQMGALLLVGHWYEHRETVVLGTTVSELPLGTECLWQPYREYAL